jgi:hypothetical protein
LRQDLVEGVRGGGQIRGIAHGRIRFVGELLLSPFFFDRQGGVLLGIGVVAGRGCCREKSGEPLDHVLNDRQANKLPI